MKKLNKKNRYLLLCLISVVLVIVIILILVSGRNKTMVCTSSSDQSKNGYIYETKNVVTYKGDYVDTIETTEIVKSDNKDVLNKYEKVFKKQYKYNKDTYGGYTYKVIKNKKEVIATNVTDYSKFNMKKFVKNNIVMEKFVENNKLTVDSIKRMYVSTGAKCN